MWATLVLFASFLFALALPANNPYPCLPKGIENSDIVSAPVGKPGRTVAGKVTVEQKLKEIKARCRSGKLVDASGKQIYFYRLQGCWGNPPADYREILSQQNSELEKLRKRYRVIEMTCNPTGEQIH